jgi:hypothetical protein
MSRREITSGMATTLIASSEKSEQIKLIYQTTLNNISTILRNHVNRSKSVFISYAWEEKQEDNKSLQDLLWRISEDLRTVGITVYLDITNMKGNMESWMKESIDSSDFVMLIGTPRYKARASQNDTNVAFEFQLIQQKLNSTNITYTLLPLLYYGDFQTSFPSGVDKYLIRDFRDMGKYYHNLLGVAKPLGILPNIYPELEMNGRLHAEYMTIYELFETKIKLLEEEVRSLRVNSLRTNALPPIPDELPNSSPNFVGREEIFKEIRNLFQSNGKVVVRASKLIINYMGHAFRFQ